MMETREALTMPPVVIPDQRQVYREARLELVRQVKLGATASEARRRCSNWNRSASKNGKPMTSVTMNSANKNAIVKSNGRYYAR
jgi:hypothetical protein